MYRTATPRRARCKYSSTTATVRQPSSGSCRQVRSMGPAGCAWTWPAPIRRMRRLCSSTHATRLMRSAGTRPVTTRSASSVSASTCGTQVQLFDCNGTGSQAWVSQSNGSLLNPQSGRCLDDPNNNEASGDLLQIYDCNGTAAQQFRLGG